MLVDRPKGLLAGFHAEHPDTTVPELVHIGEQWAPNTYRIPRHSHPHWELYLQSAGATRWKAENNTYEVPAGGFFAVAPGITHELCERPAGKHHFFFASLDMLPVLRRQPDLMLFWSQSRIICFADADPIEPAFRQLIKEVAEPSLHRSVALRLCLDYLIVCVSRLAQKVATAKSFTGMHPAVLRAKAYLETHYGEHCRLAELAQVAGLSPTHFSELFTRQVGLPPHQYLLRVRITRARELLRNSDINITELAQELGFNSSQHFALWFKRMTGTPASAYRRTLVTPSSSAQE